MPARTNMPTCLFPALQVMGPAEKQRPIRFQGAQLLQKLRSSVSSQVAFSIPPTGFSLTHGLAETYLQVLTSLQVSVV